MSIIGSKSAKLGVVLSYSGTNKGRLYKVRFDDGSESEHKAKNLQVEASKVNTSWDLTGVIGSGLVTTSTATVELAIVVGGNPYLLTGDGRGKFKAAPWRTGGGMDALSFKQSELLSDIKNGDIKWFFPESKQRSIVAFSASGKAESSEKGSDLQWSERVNSDDSDDSDDGDDNGVESEGDCAPSSDSGGRKRASRRRFGLGARSCRNSGNIGLLRAGLSTRPKTYRGRRACSGGNPHHSGMGWILRKNGDPLADNNKVGLDVDWYRASECVGIMDFLSEYPSHTPEICNLKCPACGKSGGISAKGWNNGATTCYDLASSFPCVVKRYRCTRCSEASNKHEKETDFTVMDVCGQFDPALRERLPVVVGKKLMTCDLLDSITSLAMRGMSISSIHEHCCEVYNSHHCRKHANYLRHARSYSKSSRRFFSTNEIEAFETRPLCHSPSLDFIRKAIIEDRKRSIATELRYITSLTGKVMKSDHTFWATKFCRENHKELYGSLFGIMNEHAEILLWSFGKTKSMNELASALSDFKERFSEAGVELPTCWYVDNPKETEKLLKFGVRDPEIFDGFGDELMVMADLFHVI